MFLYFSYAFGFQNQWFRIASTIPRSRRRYRGTGVSLDHTVTFCSNILATLSGHTWKWKETKVIQGYNDILLVRTEIDPCGSLAVFCNLMMLNKKVDDAHGGVFILLGSLATFQISFFVASNDARTIWFKHGQLEKKNVLNISGAYLGGGFWRKKCFVGLTAFAFCYDAVGLLLSQRERHLLTWGTHTWHGGRHWHVGVGSTKPLLIRFFEPDLRFFFCGCYKMLEDFRRTINISMMFLKSTEFCHLNLVHQPSARDFRAMGVIGWRGSLRGWRSPF